MMKPEVQHIAITRSDGSLAVMQFVTRSVGFAREATDTAINAEIAKAGIVAASWRRILLADVPVDRSDRDAWQDNGAVIAVNAVRKAALLEAKRNRQVDSLQTDVLLAIATAVFEIMKGVVAIPQPSLLLAQFRAYLKSKLT